MIRLLANTVGIATTSMAFKCSSDYFQSTQYYPRLTDDAMDEMTKSIDFGIGAGAAYELPMGLMFDVRYNLGMSNISDVDGVDMKNTGIQLGLGYRF